MKLEDKIKKDQSISLDYERIREEVKENIIFNKAKNKKSFNFYIKLCTISLAVILIGIFSYIMIDKNISQGIGSSRTYSNYVQYEGEEKRSLLYEELRDQEYLEFLDKLDIFSNKISEIIYDNYSDKYDNYAISPVSLYMALAMCVECSDNQTRQEILNVLGMTYEDVKQHTGTLYSSLNDIKSLTDWKETQTYKEMLTNSIWVDSEAILKEEGLLSLAQNYHCSSFSVPFSSNNKKANKAISDFVNEKTFGLIKQNFNLSDRTVFTLINTYYVKDTWNIRGKDLSLTEDKYNFNNEKLINLMQSSYEVGNIFDAKTYTHFYARTSNGLKIKFFVPKEGYTLNDIYIQENLNEVHNVKDYKGIDDEKGVKYNTRVFFPAFEAKFNEDISNQLKALNISSLFDDENCDFTHITDGEVYCGKVIHASNLKVTRKGIEGAAVTIMEAPGAAPPEEYIEIYQDFIVDKSFAYVITDDRNVAIFSGVVNKI